LALLLALITGVRGRGILRNPFAGSCIVPVLCSVKCPIAAVLRFGLDTTSCGATHIYIVVDNPSSFIPLTSATALSC
jgi:hypothetical protein